MEVKVTILCPTRKEPLQVCGSSLLVEELLVAAAQYCGLTPKVIGLFGLFNPALGFWHSLCWRIKASTTLHFRLRFRPPSAQVLASIDMGAFDFYFQQARNDLLAGKIPELSQHQNEMLGLVATDIIRDIIEADQKPETYNRESMVKFIPKDMNNPLMKLYVRPMLESAVMKGWANSLQNVDYVKVQYLNLLHKTVPDYGFESYTVLLEQGSVWEVDIDINPFAEDDTAGVRMTSNNKEVGELAPQLSSLSSLLLTMVHTEHTSKTIHLFTIEDICFINCREDLTAEISHKNGCPSHLQFQSVEQMHSVITALDGYFRLLEKWTFNLCPAVETPSLVMLRKLRAHGPIGLKASKAKLRTRGQARTGCYVIRQSRSHFHQLRVDVCRGGGLVSLAVKQDGDKFGLLGALGAVELTQEQLGAKYESLEELLRAVFPGKMSCLMPSEYELMPTLLYRKEVIDPPPVLDSKRCIGQILCPDRLKLVEEEHHGRFTDCATGELVLEEGTRPVKVFVKWLRKEAAHFLDEWLNEISRKSYWKCNTLVHYYGCRLTQPVALVMEHCALGSLDVYLRHNHKRIMQEERVEIVFYIAQALAYLGRLGLTHGKVRCSKILVDSDSDGIRVKLGDSGLLRYSVEDVYWIPPELYHDFSHAQNSAPADIWAAGMTFWEIFSNGEHPQSSCPLEECQDRFLRGEMLPQPKDCCNGIWRVIQDCWAQEHMRKTPSSLIRDINQVIYDVYNMRRYHNYAYPRNNSAPRTAHKPPVTPPPLPPPPPSPNKKTSGILRLFMKRSSKPATPKKSFNYRNLSTSSQGSVVSAADTAITGSTYVQDDLSLDVDRCSTNVRRPWIGRKLRDIAPSENRLSPPQDICVVRIDQVQMLDQLGEGFYGVVFKALIDLPNYPDPVACKILHQNNTDLAALENFQSEIELMRKLRHPNIVQIKALVEDTSRQMLLMEYLERGSLLKYLQNRKPALECSQLLAFARDVVEGMVYLSQLKIVHRDLAARNILVASDNHVKISDFGLARNIKGDYYRLKTEHNLPIRWYAPESIKYGKFSSKSDVWSWGITLWEMFSGAQDPVIPGVAEVELARVLDSGKRLACPAACPVEVYNLMLKCWAQHSELRPDFLKLRRLLADLIDTYCN